MSKLIVIEGLDGSGKSTQLELLISALEKDGKRVRKIKLPDYESPSSTLVKMYLGGEFGKDPNAVNAYAAGAFYAVDRYATSNSIYQTEKIAEADWDSYLDWSADFEYNKLGIPKPDAVIYLDMPVDISQKLMTGRYGGNESKKDVHEADVAFLEKCRKSALYAASRQGWQIVECSNGKEPYSIEKIHNEIMKIVDEELC